jgi:hypothetical protein
MRVRHTGRLDYQNLPGDKCEYNKPTEGVKNNFGAQIAAFDAYLMALNRAERRDL